MELLCDGGSADDGAPLEDRNLETGRSEIGRADQPVVAAADDDGIARDFTHSF
jgi:hypothetical protein